MKRGNNPYDSLVSFISRCNISTREEVRLREIISDIKKFDESTPLTGESEAIERDRDAKYTYYHVDFNNCPAYDGDYMICESLDEVRDLLQLVDVNLDDPESEAIVEIKGVGMTPNEYAQWFNENI